MFKREEIEKDARGSQLMRNVIISVYVCMYYKKFPLNEMYYIP